MSEISLIGHRYSFFRLEKMLSATTEKEATTLRGWHVFLAAIGNFTGHKFDSVSNKEKELNELWERLHAKQIPLLQSVLSDPSILQREQQNDKQIPNNNIERLITFNKMRQLINTEDNPSYSDFQIEISRPNGFTSDINFKINQQSILKTQISHFEKKLINTLTSDKKIDGLGNLSNELSEINIRTREKALKPSEKNAAKTIQRHVRSLQELIRGKSKTNNYTELKYKSPYNNKTTNYIITANKVGYVIPEENIEDSAQKGSTKYLAGKNTGTALLKKHNVDDDVFFSANLTDLTDNKSNIPNIAFNGNQIEEILIELKIKSIKVTHQINKDTYIARNAGDNNLWHHIKRKSFGINFFEEITKAIKTLHNKDYFFLDIKPLNIQVKIIEDKVIKGKLIKGKVELSLIDTDSFSSVQKLSYPFGSFFYSHLGLLNLLQETKDELDNLVKGNLTGQNTLAIIEVMKKYSRILQIIDEYALVITMLQASHIEIPFRKTAPKSNFSSEGLKLTDQIKLFITKNIKLEYKEHFELLISAPDEYITKYSAIHPKILLHDMLNYT